MDYYMKIVNIPLTPLHFLGINPAKSLSTWKITYVSITAMIMLYLIFIQFWTEEINLKLYSRVLESSFVTVHGMVKLITVVLKKKQAYELLENIRKFWTYEDPNQEIQEEYVRDLKFLRRTVIIFISAATTTGVTYLIRPLFTPDLPIVSYVPESVPFPILVIFSGIATIAYSLMVVGFDTFACCMLSLLTLQFKILNNRIASIKFKETPDDDEVHGIENEIKTCVNYHNFLFGFLNTFNEFVSINFLVQYFLTTVLVCFELLIISKNPNDFLEVAKCIMALIVLGVQLTMLYCWPALRVTTESSRIIFTVYETGWLNCSYLPIRKHLILIMQRAQKNAVISAGKMYIVNLESCTMIFKTSLSFFTYLNTLGQDNKP